MSVRAAQVLAFPGIDLKTLAELRARACDAFMRDDLNAYQDACDPEADWRPECFGNGRSELPLSRSGPAERTTIATRCA